MSIFVAILALSFLILVHELGHFTAAKLLGVKVLGFSIFMGPKLISYTKGDTTYAIRLIPIGGSVRMEGEEESSEDSRAFNNKPKWVRAVILSAGSFMNLITALILMLILNLNAGYLVNELNTIQPGSPVDIASVQLLPGDVITKYNGKTVHTPSEISVYLQDSKGASAEVTFVRNGEVMTTNVKPEVIPAVYHVLGFSGSTAYGDDWSLAAAVDEEGSAYDAGMRAGDRLVSVNDQTPKNREELREILAQFDGQPVTMRYERGGEIFSGLVEPRVVENVETYVLGVSFMEVKTPGLLDSIKYAVYDSVAFGRLVLYSLKWLVTGDVGVSQMSGPVGIVTAIGDVVESGKTFRESLFGLMQFVALIGINLGLFNLIPFPALDGSKLLLLAVEAVRRKPIPPERETVISMVGFALLIVLMVFTVFNDISRLVAK